MTSLKSINTLHILFAHYGIPKEVVSDNRLQLASSHVFRHIKMELQSVQWRRQN